MMNFYKRGLIFATFLGCCLSLSFLAASLSTDRWVIARVQRSTNPSESDGHVFFGLFTGRRELNVGYGWRTYSLSVIEQIRKEPELLHLGLWVSTLSCVCGTIVFAFIGALMAVVNTATSPIESMTGRVGLFVWNTLALLFSLAALVTWMSQFYVRLSRNVLIQEDRDNHWSSQGQAGLGYSFWFVVGATISHVTNMVLLALVKADERRKYIKPSHTEKTNGSVLLY